jgi:hypothetical protein
MLSRPIILCSLFTLILSGLAVGCDGDDTSQSAAAGSAGSPGGAAGSSASGGSAGTTGGGGSGGSAGTTGGGGTGGQVTSFKLSGVLSYEYVPYNLAEGGLDYAAIEKRPIRGVSVRLLDADTSVEIAKTLSDDKGAYSFDYMDTTNVQLWVYAETESPVITVEDNTSGDAVYILESAMAKSGADVKLDVLASTGWAGTSYADPRLAAPFAVLDTCYTAGQRFLDEIAVPPKIPPLKVNWSIDNRPEDGDKALGQIGTSHFDKKELYILGKEDVDTDEFDSHVMVHEWGHFFQNNLGRSDSPGGGHGDADVNDPRLAWAEGFCNALSAILLAPDSVYKDSSGLEQSEGSLTDMDLNDSSMEVKPGWFSEATVQQVVYDMYDDGVDEPFDKVTIGLDGIYAAMVADRDTPALATLFSFTAWVKADAPQAAANIDALMDFYNVDADFGVDPVQDAWATGETHTAGLAPALPLYKDASIGGMVTAELLGGESFNRLAQNRYFRIIGDGQPVTVQATSASDIDLFVYHVGQKVAESTNVGGDEELTFATVAGDSYVLNVQGFDDQAAPYFADISVMH